jgi:AhpD family alkylhydroperoxidase
MDAHRHVYPAATGEQSRMRRELAPDAEGAFRELGRRVFSAGALDVRTKQLIAVAVAHVTQCPYCIRGHTKAAIRAGAAPREIMEAIWVAAEMRAGAAFAHSAIALEAMTEGEGIAGAPADRSPTADASREG